MFIYAGAVTYGGRAIVLPGTSGAGKSTLVAQLLRLGADYYSDEYAVVDSRGWLRPFPCLLKLKDGLLGPRRVPAEEFGARVGEAPAPVELLVFPRYPTDTALHSEPLTKSRAALHLLEHMPAARLNPGFALAAAADLWRRCDGTTSLEQILQGDTAAWELLARLRDDGLVMDVPASPPKLGVSRRSFIVSGPLWQREP